MISTGIAAPAATAAAKAHSPQLDVLRGLAIVFMVVNHVGVRLLAPALQDGGLGVLVFIGGFAPVIFFFTTGYGTGIGKRDMDVQVFVSTLWKAGLLVVADQFMFWQEGVRAGLDFLSFIALSSVVIALLAASKRPIIMCVALIAVALTLRFGIGPRLQDGFPPSGVIACLTGVGAVENCSYTFAPWIVYPLLGFLAARYHEWRVSAGRPFLGPGMGALCVVALAIAAYLRGHQWVFYRWGSMSTAFFVLSIGVIPLCLALAWHIAARHPAAAKALSLRGIASLAVVPIHYGLIYLAASAWGERLGGLATLVAMIGFAVLSMALSKFFAACVNRWLSGAPTWSPLYPASMLVVGCAYVTIAQPCPSAAVFAAFVAGQLGVTLLMAIRDQRNTRRKERAPFAGAIRTESA